MATIAIQVTETGQTTLSKSYTLADSDMDTIVAAFQLDANRSIGRTATRAQVFNYIAGQWTNIIKLKVQQFKTTPAVVPPPISIT